MTLPTQDSPDRCDCIPDSARPLQRVAWVCTFVRVTVFQLEVSSAIPRLHSKLCAVGCGVVQPPPRPTLSPSLRGRQELSWWVGPSGRLALLSGACWGCSSSVASPRGGVVLADPQLPWPLSMPDPLCWAQCNSLRMEEKRRNGR